VRTQIQVAQGAPLPWRQEQIRSQGHAIECRVYAEDPARNFMPSLGRLLLLHEPQGPGVRIDSGVRQGDEVTMFYDPMIAKLALHAGSRDDCIDRALTALRDYAVLGVTTNVEYLIAVLDHPAFRAGETHTGFIPDHLAEWPQAGDEVGEGAERDPDLTAALIAVAVAERGATTPMNHGNGETTPRAPSPWERLGRFRLAGLER
jgi:acetyl/propionyl-CoA carboxylase alpha subunit